ncbi:MAG: DUF2752 domain-containing protein [Planctomycetes bacterium]|nr:DUF2752 domain-containing protein [Planctomycetota bacterium]
MEEQGSSEAPAVRGVEHWAVLAAAALAFVGLLAMRWILTPDPHGYGTHEQLGLPPCRAIDWFGVPCPGCGVTTSVTWFAHASPWRSFVVQPLGFLLGSVALAGLPAALVASWLGRDLGYELRRLRLMRWWIGVTFVVAAAWIYKIVAVLARGA